MITSRTNPLIKNVKSLKDKKNRDEQNLFVVEGVKLCNEAIDSGFTVKYVIGTLSALKSIKRTNSEIIEVSEDVFSSVSSEVTPQGVLAVVIKPNEVNKNGKDCLLLDGVSDPSNVGAIVRTAAASNFKDVFLIDCADPFSPKSVRASMGGVFKVHFHYAKRESAKKEIGLPFIIADMNGTNVFEFKKDDDACLVIGNEGNGVSKEIKSQADYTLSIPMENGMESLNASVSAGILMYLLK